jgi:sulfur-oxidizing protein SoxY
VGMRSTMTRRELSCAIGAGAAVSALWGWSLPAIARTSVEEALEELLVGKSAVESTRIRLDLPPRFDYGNTVPLAFTVEGPMAEVNHVERVSVFAEGNPFPEVASFHFTSDSGRANASTRIRLNEGRREVVVVAELSGGSVWLARRTIEIAVSGCSIETGVVIGHPMPRPEPRLKVPEHARRDEIIEIKTMISHWMETGFRIDATGKPIPRRIINRMVCSRDGELIFAADLSPAIAANAYLTFSMVARAPAVLTFAWAEDGGAMYRATHSLKVI